MDALRTAFRRLLTLVPRNGRVILGADDPEAMRLAEHAHCPVETFGLSEHADWRAAEVEPRGGRMSFELTLKGQQLGHFEVPLHGAHNVRNALAALAVGHAAGLLPGEMRRGLADFRGVRRRLELRGVVHDISVFDDFAHHPTAILETLRAVRWSYPDRRLWAVFEPRSATACRRIFQQDFARAFADSEADEVLLAPVFRATLPDDERLSVEDLVRDLGRAGRRARTPGSVEDIVRTIVAEAKPGDLVVIMSNGGFEDIHDRLLAALRARFEDTRA
jgi:UDP-N-acetylmuramate: L-alanyl-gamma-D-glutamyl-meso-diaminopimelate ligase